MLILMVVALVQSNATSSKSPIYYARVPKKSPVNKKNKLGAVKSATDNIAEANKEIAVIKRFHNWVFRAIHTWQRDIKCNMVNIVHWKLQLHTMACVIPKIHQHIAKLDL